MGKDEKGEISEAGWGYWCFNEGERREEKGRKSIFLFSIRIPDPTRSGYAGQVQPYSRQGSDFTSMLHRKGNFQVESFFLLFC